MPPHLGGDEDSLWSLPVVFEEQAMATESVVTRNVPHHAIHGEGACTAEEQAQAATGNIGGSWFNQRLFLLCAPTRLFNVAVSTGQP
ncbi:hypothetical protein HVA01_02780 [Halovibrio variabilis]|uniref:Uncharacterized protein n=1 Tax=Halovibrio variabilis TaxID=31910 RepID=A0A511UNA1_9GAMM|nr:hypothetical protein [Halovibrio variabilis]GEN26632.1 hypothetical protein HVA01_02780 [Halovibrio variabilis]